MTGLVTGGECTQLLVGLAKLKKKGSGLHVAILLLSFTGQYIIVAIGQSNNALCSWGYLKGETCKAVR